MRLDELIDELLVGYEVKHIVSVSGGDINQAYRVETADGPVFIKCHSQPKPDMFAREAAGLAALRAHACPSLGIPEVLRITEHGLALSWIEPGSPSISTETTFGAELAALHRTTHATFGAIDGHPSGYLGSAEVDLTPTASWPEFFVDRRVAALARRAVELGKLSPVALTLLDAITPHATELCGPPEPPALIHGDLWAGNRMIGSGGRNWLIDPAVHWGHREYDLAMMRLFGGFSAEAFAAYYEAFPLADGWRNRVRWYQLPPLLVHAILFGGGYGASAFTILSDYAKLSADNHASTPTAAEKSTPTNKCHFQA